MVLATVRILTAIPFVKRTTPAARIRFGPRAAGYPIGMRDYGELPDDVPVADAVEQQRTASELTPDEEVSTEPGKDRPLEASAADWQEQLETVELDPDEAGAEH